MYIDSNLLLAAVTMLAPCMCVCVQNKRLAEIEDAVNEVAQDLLDLHV